MTLKADVNSLMELMFKTLKSAWIWVPMGKYSVLKVGWQMSLLSWENNKYWARNIHLWYNLGKDLNNAEV